MSSIILAFALMGGCEPNKACTIDVKVGRILHIELFKHNKPKKGCHCKKKGCKCKQH